MARYLITWSSNPVAPWPTDPSEHLKLNETMWAGIDDLMKKGEVKEFGLFLDGKSGYAIGEGDGATVFKDVSMFGAYYDLKVEEIIPFEKAKEIIRGLYKARMQAARK